MEVLQDQVNVVARFIHIIKLDYAFMAELSQYPDLIHKRLLSLSEFARYQGMGACEQFAPQKRLGLKAALGLDVLDDVKLTVPTPGDLLQFAEVRRIVDQHDLALSFECFVPSLSGLFPPGREL